MSTPGANSKSFVDQVKEQLHILSEKAGVDSRLVIMGLSIALFFVFIGYFDHYITTVIGIAYPIFWSIRAIESPDNDDDKQWLTYWVVFALFTVVDMFSGFILKFIPFYFFFKLLFLIWCFLPNFRGASLIYDVFLIKIFKKYEKNLENIQDSVMKGANIMTGEVTKVIKDNQGTILTKTLNAMNANKTE
jgi:receptor expression-enhancing protein 5/6